MKTKTSSMPTMSDVARDAGVAIGTVSRVLNGYSNISAENVARVQEAIAKLSYQKSPTARQGSKMRSGNIGLVFAEIGAAWAGHSLIAAYTLGVERACQEEKFHAIIEILGESTALPRCVTDRKVDGLLIKTTREIPHITKDIPAALPLVVVGTTDPACRFHQVTPDNEGAGWLVTDYLWNLGHRHIAFVSPNSLHPFMAARFRGYERYLRQKEAFNSDFVFMSDSGIHDAPDECPPDMNEPMQRLAALNPRPTAVVMANDWAALGAYAALNKCGLKVPEDISIVSIDNVSPLCNSMTPQLTSYAIPFAATTRAAALILFDLIAKPERHQDPMIQLIKGHLVERASVRAIA